MSMDLIIYIRDLSHLSVADCEAYLDSLGFHGHFDPDFEFMSFAGPCPFVCTVDLIGDGVLYRGDFEYYMQEYAFEPMPIRKPTLWERLTGKQPPMTRPEDDAFAWATRSILISCSCGDSLSPLLAYGFAAYAVTTCSGVLYDPQNDVVYDTPAAIGQAYTACLESVQREKEKGHLRLYRDRDGMP